MTEIKDAEAALYGSVTIRRTASDRSPPHRSRGGLGSR